MRTALIVEDEPQANKLLAALVQLRGYRTESVFDGASALEKVRSVVPDVLLLDLMLPDLHGHEVCRTLRNTGSTHLLPVVIVTARLAAENRIESFSAGADDYVAKPYTPDQIFDALDEADAWKQLLEVPAVEGTVVLDGRDDGKSLRRLAQLRSLLVARDALGRESIARLSAAIKAIWSSVDRWSRLRRTEQVASLSYELTSNLLTLTVHDEGGWLPGTDSAAKHALLSSLAGAQFDQVVADDLARHLKLVKRLEAP